MFVANHVSFIREDSSPFLWVCINTKLNPADDTSRGVSGESFIQDDCWIKGPGSQTRKESVGTIYLPCTEELSCRSGRLRSSFSPLLSKSVMPVHVSLLLLSIFRHGLNCSSLLPCLLCQRRFAEKRNWRQQSHSFSKETSIFSMLVADASRLGKGGKRIINFHQRIAFAEEIDALEHGRSVKKSSVLVKLDPILAQGLPHVSGHVGRAALAEDSKHLIIIPKNSHLTHLIVYHFY